MSPSLLLFALVTLVSSGILILTYIPIILIFHFDQSFRKNLAYTIMIQLGIQDILQLMVHFYGAVEVLWGRENVVSLLNWTIGVIFTGMWCCMLAILLFLTYNRFSVIVLQKYSIFSSRLMQVGWFLFCLLNFILPSIIEALPGCGYVFNNTVMDWGHFDPACSMELFVDAYAEVLIWIVVTCSLLAYAGVFAHMYNTSGSAAFQGREWILTLQILLIDVYFLFAIFYWYYLSEWISMDPILYNFLSTFIWIVMTGMNPFTYMLFNKRLRRSYIYFLQSLSPRGVPRKVHPVIPCRSVANMSSSH